MYFANTREKKISSIPQTDGNATFKNIKYVKIDTN